MATLNLSRAALLEAARQAAVENVVEPTVRETLG